MNTVNTDPRDGKRRYTIRVRFTDQTGQKYKYMYEMKDTGAKTAKPVTKITKVKK